MTLEWIWTALFLVPAVFLAARARFDPLEEHLDFDVGISIVAASCSGIAMSIFWEAWLPWLGTTFDEHLPQAGSQIHDLTVGVCVLLVALVLWLTPLVLGWAIASYAPRIKKAARAARERTAREHKA